MNKIIILTLLLLSNCVFSQNVGIGTATPSEKLDVDGNINLTGSIKANGVDGAANQLLGKNSAGSLAWIDISEFKNFKVFINTSATVWTVPAGTTKVMVEAWGGGGGGAQGGGGSSGNYLIARADVVSGNTFTITCGNGGAPPAINGNGIATAGGNTIINIVSGSPVTLNARGGGGGAYNSNGTPSYPAFPANIPIQNYMGEQGETNTETYTQYQAGVFVTSVYYGRGGNSPFAPGTGCKGGFLTYNTATPSNWIKWYFPAGSGSLPGGGGAATPDIGSGSYGTYGGNGMVIVRW